jgi:K+ transporter
MIYTWLTLRHVLFRCCNPINIKDIVESFTENRAGESQEEIKEEVVFHTKDMKTNPFALLGVNIPSYYGGF